MAISIHIDVQNMRFPVINRDFAENTPNYPEICGIFDEYRSISVPKGEKHLLGVREAC
jgi:hypothetical protein